jgi:hypothetical protein
VPVRSVSSAGLDEVRDAYEETVMSVPHYEAMYNEPYATNLKQELGPDVATALTEGQSFDQRYKQAVLASVRNAVERRSNLIDAYDQEESSLNRFADDLGAVVTELAELDRETFANLGFGALEARYSRLDVLRSKTTTAIEDRQTGLVSQRRSLQMTISDPDIPSCTYGDLDRTYPVIATAVTVFDAIERLQDHIASCISTY